jgi:glyoxylase-like metal-dependent hydrolase (beta-lactamase superfamily II)/rhodanese-related sulfurtransferase
MKIEQIYTGCLAQGAYYVTSGSEAIIIDPLREITPYMSRAQADAVTIKYILETHFHADFVSGHLDLAKATGAPIVFGPLADPQFAFHSAKDGEVLPFGDCSVRVLHTPGHTMESTCYLLIDENGSEHALFSGDTLFIGDVGRPDLAQKSAAMTQEELAGTLFDSLRNKIMPLADHIIVYPAHGAGSSCGKNMSKETFDTLGNQKMVNYALRSDMDRSAFIKELTDGLLPPPSYFGMNVAMNKKGYDSIHDVMARGLKALSRDQFTSLAPEALILDTRPATEFAQGFIPGSIFIGLEGQFAPWVGALIPDVTQEIILVTPDGKEEETVRRLARVGYDNVRGYLDGGIRAWEDTLDSIGRVEASEVEQGLTTNERLIDVRKPGEYESEHLADVPSIPLDFINERMAEFPKDKELVLLCGGGYRSMIAASILKSRGFEGIKDVIGGYAALAKTNLPKVTVACASTQS